MKKKWLFLVMWIALAGAVVFRSSVPSFAEDNAEDLKKQIEALKAEVADLKASRQPNVSAPEDDLFSLWGYGSSGYWDPFAEMQQMQDRINRLFRQSLIRSNAFAGPSSPGLSSFYEPDLDIRDMKDHYILTLDLPGMDKDKINVEVTEHDIVISGERDDRSEEQDDRHGFYRMERRFGSFSRRLPLPDDATPDGVSADYEKGVLEIRIPKKDPAEGKKTGQKVKIK